MEKIRITPIRNKARHLVRSWIVFEPHFDKALGGYTVVQEPFRFEEVQLSKVLCFICRPLLNNLSSMQGSYWLLDWVGPNRAQTDQRGKERAVEMLKYIRFVT